MQIEPIMLREKRYNYLPQRFLHRGIEQLVRRVRRTWDVAASRDRNARRYYEVDCAGEQSFRLVHDVTLNVWFAEC